MGVTKVRREFTAVVNKADDHGEPIFLVNFNEPRAVLVGYRAWEALMERLEDLEDALSLYERRGEPTRPFEEYLAERAKREHGSPEDDPTLMPAVAVAVR